MLLEIVGDILPILVTLGTLLFVVVVPVVKLLLS